MIRGNLVENCFDWEKRVQQGHARERRRPGGFAQADGQKNAVVRNTLIKKGWVHSLAPLPSGLLLLPLGSTIPLMFSFNLHVAIWQPNSSSSLLFQLSFQFAFFQFSLQALPSNLLIQASFFTSFQIFLSNLSLQSFLCNIPRVAHISRQRNSRDDVDVGRCHEAELVREPFQLCITEPRVNAQIFTSSIFVAGSSPRRKSGARPGAAALASPIKAMTPCRERPNTSPHAASISW